MPQRVTPSVDIELASLRLLFGDSGGEAKSVRAPNSNRKLLVRAHIAVVSLEKTLNANIPTSGDAAQWIKQVVIRKVVDSRLRS